MTKHKCKLHIITTFVRNNSEMCCKMLELFYLHKSIYISIIIYTINTIYPNKSYQNIIINVKTQKMINSISMD